MKCKDCKRYRPLSYTGGRVVYYYCFQGDRYEPIKGEECEFKGKFRKAKENA